MVEVAAGAAGVGRIGVPAPAARWWSSLRHLVTGLLLASRPQVATDVDPSVVARARGGDPAAFTDLVRHYDGRLRALAFRLLGDAPRTDDVLQEAYVKAFRSLDRFRGDASLGTWLYRITYNACLDELRRGRPVVPLEEASPHAAVSSDPAGTAVARRDLAAALAQLPADQRAAVVLVDAEGMDYAEAAEVLGIPKGTVASRLHRAHATLRRLLAAP